MNPNVELLLRTLEIGAMFSLVVVAMFCLGELARLSLEVKCLSEGLDLLCRGDEEIDPMAFPSDDFAEPDPEDPYDDEGPEDEYDYTADDLAFDAARERRLR